MGTRHPSIVPYECFQVKDGFVNIGVTNQKQWTAFCHVLGLPGLATDERFATMKERLTHYDTLKEIITPPLRTMTREAAIAALSQAEIPVGPVNTLAEILEDPHIRARDMILELTHPEYGPIKQLGLPIKMSETPGIVAGAPPRFGEHNEQVLSMLGYEEDVIEECRRLGVVAGNRS